MRRFASLTSFGVPSLSAPKQLVRVGFSTAGSSLILGDGADGVSFESTGFSFELRACYVFVSFPRLVMCFLCVYMSWYVLLCVHLPKYLLDIRTIFVVGRRDTNIRSGMGNVEWAMEIGKWEVANGSEG